MQNLKKKLIVNNNFSSEIIILLNLFVAFCWKCLQPDSGWQTQLASEVIILANNEYQLEVVGVSKAFGGTQALKDVHLQIKKGEVHALLGENGAGKSTLMKIVMGLYKADTGEVFFDGQKVTINSPSQALNIGISMVHQELNPEPHMTIAENIFLHREPGKLFVDENEMNRKTVEILKQFNFDLSPKRKMDTLTVAQMQMIEIIKAVTFNSKLVIMDEPTSSLDSDETEHLFKTIKDLKKRGISIIYISHRMEEIFEIADAVSVFRDGQYIGSDLIKNVTRESLITMMVGRKIGNIFPKTDVDIGDVCFEVKDFNKKGVFKDITFSVRHGEILGFSGLVGAGRSEIMKAIIGLDKKDSGEVYYDGKKLKINSPRDSIRQGIAMVNEDRKAFGLMPVRSIRENISLPNLETHQKGLLLNEKKEKKEVDEVSKKLTVKCAGLEAPAISLSGGNQQKVVISKWIMADPKVLILDEPTRGIDVGAKAEIHKLMCQFAAKGMAIILISSELPEIMGMSDRILVISEGKLNGEFKREDIVSGKVTQEDILDKALGG